jgi:hypothetical protein
VTELDKAHAAMEAAPEDDAARLRFYDRLAASELFLMLEKEPDADALDPELFELGDARFVLVFDSEGRMSEFTGRIVPYAALSGRALVQMLAGQGIGLGVNLEVAPSSILIPSEAVDWLAGTLDHAPQQEEAKLEEVRAPSALPDALLSALDTRLASAAGLARKAYLAEVTYQGGGRGHVIGLTGVVPGAEGALAQAINEALIFSGVEAGALDVLFLADTDTVAGQLARVALRFDLPEPPAVQENERPAPGSDPDKPPILR